MKKNILLWLSHRNRIMRRPESEILVEWKNWLLNDKYLKSIHSNSFSKCLNSFLSSLLKIVLDLLESWKLSEEILHHLFLGQVIDPLILCFFSVTAFVPMNSSILSSVFGDIVVECLDKEGSESLRISTLAHRHNLLHNVKKIFRVQKRWRNCKNFGCYINRIDTHFTSDKTL